MIHLGGITSPFDVSIPNCVMIAFITKCHPETVELVTNQNPFPSSPSHALPLHRPPHHSIRTPLESVFRLSKHHLAPILAGSSDGILSSIPITPDLFACLDWHVLATHAAPSLARRLGTHRVVFGW
ncbi:hypothetical protein BLNAU_15332 [Blattamonas nauphoetae]|uniref:Uncharacterized protein n=1 Tax=Blattamonas nauphoetae TaxID=2049346 RepID=A0ABQ9XEN6_9EUKA|nr:hypothetical protein BLNAU_15332 [Blattamonas nauphoetae]